MTVFEDSAEFYDSLYQDKDYLRECDFLEAIFRRHGSFPVKSIVDLGCGTGGHLLPLLRRGYEVTGVDRSERMLEIAHNKIDAAADSDSRPVLIHRDILDFHLDQSFDAAISMFAVISYILQTDDLISAFSSVRRHLRTGGLFIFDAWFGPAALNERPEDRYKIIRRNKDEKLLRFVHSSLNLIAQTVDVDYWFLFIQNNRVVKDFHEGHSMRFLFPQEVIYYLRKSGFKVASLCPFPKLDQHLTEHDWNFSVVAVAD